MTTNEIILHPGYFLLKDADTNKTRLAILSKEDFTEPWNDYFLYGDFLTLNNLATLPIQTAVNFKYIVILNDIKYNISYQSNYVILEPI